MRSASVGFRRNSRASPRTVPLSAGDAPWPCSASSARSRVACSPSRTPPLAGPFASLGDRHDHAVQRVHVLLGRLHARENVAQIDQHGLALLRRTQEFDVVELAHQIVEEGLHLVLRGALRTLGHREGQRSRGRELEPFVADQQHRLRQVERGEARIDRKGDDPVGQRHLLILQAVALAAEQDADIAAAADLGRHFAGGGIRRHHGFGLIVGARGGREQQRAVGDRLLDRVEQFDAVQDVVGARGRALRRGCWASRRAGLTIRSRVSAKLPMARAAMPMFSPSCGSTRMTTGPARSMPVLVLSVPEPDMSLHFLIQRLKNLNQAPKKLIQDLRPAPVRLPVQRGFLKRNNGVSGSFYRVTTGIQKAQGSHVAAIARANAPQAGRSSRSAPTSRTVGPSGGSPTPEAK